MHDLSRHFYVTTTVANNVITVGSESRCQILASLLDKHSNVSSTTTDGNPSPSTTATITPSSRRSKRGFITHTGTYNGIPVSIVMINMGYPNMDFLVREIRAVTEGPLRIVRLGSCASLRSDLPVGTVVVASEGSVFIRQNPDSWASALTGAGAGREGSVDAVEQEPYVFSGVAPADKELSTDLLRELKHALEEDGGREDGGTAVVGCLNASADSFYSSQGKCLLKQLWLT